MHQSSGKMHPRVRTLNTRLRGRQQGEPFYWADSADRASSGIYLNPEGQVIDAGLPAPGAVADTPAQGVGVSATSQLTSPSVQATSAPVVTDVPATAVPSATLATGSTSAITSVVDTPLPTSSSAPLSSAPTDVLDSTTFTSSSTVNSLSLSSLSTSPLAIVPTTSLTSLSTTSFSVVPTTSSTPTSTSTSTSDSSTETSQVDSSDDDERKQAFFLAIAFGVIMVVLLIAGIVTWFVRTRRIRRAYREEPSWPWDHEPLDARQDKLEGGLGIHTDEGQQVKRWDSNLMIEKANDLVPPPPPAHLQGSSPFVANSYGSQPSVSELTQDMGTLHIRNLAPGDLSGGETSRASTALGVANTYPEEYGTPFQPQRPAFMSLDGQGLETPWAPLRPRKSRVAEGLKQRQYAPEAGARAEMEEISLDEPLPYPGEHRAPAPTTAEGDEQQDSWASSFRSNLYNVYSAVVGGSTPQVSSDVAGDDGFTRQPPRHSQRRRAGPLGPRDDISHADTGDPSSREASWTLEETGMGRGIVHIRDSLEGYNVPRTYGLNPFDDDSAHRSAYTDPRVHSARKSGPVTRDNSMHSMTSVEHPPSRVGLRPPRLPSIPSLSATTSEEYGGGSRRKDSRRSNYRKGTKKYGRPALSSRKSSHLSAISVRTDMSRTSSGYSDDLTDGERYAKEIMRERRRRMHEMSVGRTKTSRSRATMLSRRRSNLSFKQRREL